MFKVYKQLTYSCSSDYAIYASTNNAWAVSVAAQNMTFLNSTKWEFNKTFYCSLCNGTNPELTYLPTNVWCEQNNYTRFQLYNLLKKRKIIGLRHKSKMYVATNPNYEGD